MAGLITGQNSVTTIQCFNYSANPAAHQIQGFNMDNPLSFQSLDLGTYKVGLNNDVAYGTTLEAIVCNITIFANSDSLDYFDGAIKQNRKGNAVYPITLTVAMPSIGKRFVLTNGAFVSGTVFPDIASGVLSDRSYNIHFNDLDVTAL